MAERRLAGDRPHDRAGPGGNSHMGRARSLLGLVADLASICSAVALCLMVLVLVMIAARVREITPQAASRRTTVRLDGLVTSEGSRAVHPPGARVALVEFSDFQCPFCVRYARNIYPRLKKEFVDSGRVAYSFRHFPLAALHPFASTAGEAAECAGEQGHFWEMRQQLFGGRRDLNEVGVLEYARDLALDAERFETCLAGGANAAIMKDQAEGRRLGVRSTPTFLLGWVEENGQIRLHTLLQGAESYEQLRAAITEMLSNAASASTGTRP